MTRVSPTAGTAIATTTAALGPDVVVFTCITVGGGLCGGDDPGGGGLCAILGGGGLCAIAGGGGLCAITGGGGLCTITGGGGLCTIAGGGGLCAITGGGGLCAITGGGGTASHPQHPMLRQLTLPRAHIAVQTTGGGGASEKMGDGSAVVETLSIVGKDVESACTKLASLPMKPSVITTLSRSLLPETMNVTLVDATSARILRCAGATYCAVYGATLVIEMRSAATFSVWESVFVNATGLKSAGLTPISPREAERPTTGGGGLFTDRGGLWITPPVTVTFPCMIFTCAGMMQ